MPIPVFQMQGSGAFHVPGLCEPIRGYHVHQALDSLPHFHRSAVQRYLRAGGLSTLPPSETLQALKLALIQILEQKQMDPP